MTRPALEGNSNRPGFFLAAIVTALIMLFGTGIVSTATASAAQSPVGVRALDVHVTAEPHGGVDSCHRPGNCHSTYVSALGAGGEEGLLSPRLAPESSYDGVEPVYDALVLGADVRTAVQVEASGCDTTAAPLRSRSGAAAEGPVAVSGFFVAAKTATSSVEGLLRPGGALIGKAGTNNSIRELTGGLSGAQSMFQQLSQGGKIVAQNAKLTRVELPNGGFVQLRTVMSRSPGRQRRSTSTSPGSISRS